MRHRVQIRKEEKLFGKKIGYVDGKVDAALLLKKVLRNYSTKVKIEKDIAMVGKPEKYNLSQTALRFWI